MILLLYACATPPFSEGAETTPTEAFVTSTSIFEEPPPNTQPSETTIHFSNLACDLSVLLGEFQSAGTGTVQAVEEGLSGLPWDAPEREYVLVRITVEEVAVQADAAKTGQELPILEAGQPVDVILYPDLTMTPSEPVVKLASTGETIFFGLSGVVDVNNRDAASSWFVRRIAVVSDASIAFTGSCSEMLDQQFADFAKALSRPADVDLIMELAAEVVASASDSEVGPLEETLIETLY